MEKQVNMEDGSASAGSRNRTHLRRRTNAYRSKWVVLTVVCILAIQTLRRRQGTWFPLDLRRPSTPTANDHFTWHDLPILPYLEYTDCYDGDFQCARLELPMDYWNGTTNATISLAVIKKPAVVPVTHPQYGGAILLNPGGPGGSGVFFLQAAADQIRHGVDADNGKYFDLISFDPRGIEKSTPGVQCFTDLMLYQSWQLRLMEEGVLGASDAAFGRFWSMYNARGKSCSLPAPEGVADIKKYVSTASVARDMLEIVEQHGRWREKEAKQLLVTKSTYDRSTSAETSRTTSDALEALRYKPGKERINYLGFSYGSYLGNTFAAMYPERIDRLVVDGVVDAYDYTKTIWLDNLFDTEKDFDLFYYHCARVGFPKCALGNQTGPTTAEGVKKRTLDILESLYHNPLPVISAKGPEVISYSDVKELIFGILYAPSFGFPFLAKILADIEHGDGDELARILRFAHSFDCPSSTDAGITQLRSRLERGAGAMSIDGQMAILCGDGDDQSWLTKTAFQEHIKNVTKLSPSFGEIWATIRMSCVHYNVRPYYRFEGPWVGNTSHPILEIGNTADPVTPGRYAKKMAKGFPGAVALIQDSAGHCSLSTPSVCTERYIRQYFQTGELPPEGTVCKADYMPFGPSPESEVHEELSMEVAKRQARIANALFTAGGGFLMNERLRGITPWLA